MDVENCRHLKVVGLHDTGPWWPLGGVLQEDSVTKLLETVLCPWPTSACPYSHELRQESELSAGLHSAFDLRSSIDFTVLSHDYIETSKQGCVGRNDQLIVVRFLTHDVCLLVGFLTSQQHASVSQGRICSDNFTCCHTETEVADQTHPVTVY